MCGISGIITPRQQLDARLLTRSLRHRGPDHAGTWGQVHDDYAIELGHTRLSILDLSENGNQPMHSPDGRYVIVFNGEIYNYRQLKQQYLGGVNLQSSGDTEVLLHLWMQLGENCLQELNGDFAFALFDRQQHQLFLVRDRAGVKPLYFYQDYERFCFGSELKVLCDLGVNREVNELGITSFLVYKYSPENETLIKGIKRLGPGEMLKYDLRSHKTEIQTWWQPQKNTEIAKLNYKEAKHLLYETLEDAVKLRLVSDVPVGAFLSGGVDSTILAHFLRHQKDLQYYVAGKSAEDLAREGSTSDAYFAKLLAGQWNLPLTEIPISSNETNPELIRETVFYGDDLIADGSQIPSLLITRGLAQNSRVILSGMGADEIFLGYAGHQLALLAGYADKLPTGLAQWLTRKMSGIEQGNGRFLAYRRYLHKFGKAYQQGEIRNGLFSIVGEFEAAAKLYPHGRAQAQQVMDRYFRTNEDPFDQLFRFEYHNFLQKNLNYLDRMAMANGVEGRVPFMDHRLIELAYSLPLHYKLGPFGNTKKILKDTFAPRIPKAIIKRRKAGFGMPLRSILRDEQKLNTLLDEAFFENLHGFSMDQLAHIKTQHIKGYEDHSALLYALISLRIWMKEFVG